MRRVSYTATLLDPMQGYARLRTKDDFRPFVMDRDAGFHHGRGAGPDAARCSDLPAAGPNILSYLPEGFTTDPGPTPVGHRLDLRRLAGTGEGQGNAELRQGDTFAPIQIRRKEGRDG